MSTFPRSGIGRVRVIVGLGLAGMSASVVTAHGHLQESGAFARLLAKHFGEANPEFPAQGVAKASAKPDPLPPG